MPRLFRTIALLLIAVQAWVAVSGGAGGVGCVRFWACLAEKSVESDGCSCCRGEQSDEAPPVLPMSDPDHDPGCCVHMPNLTVSTQRHDGAGDVLSVTHLTLVVYAACEVAWSPIVDPHRASAWLPPPDPGAMRAAVGLPTTRLVI